MNTLAIACFLSIVALAGCGGSGGASITPAAPPEFANPGFEKPVLQTNSWVEPGDSTSLWTGSPNWGIENGSSSWGTGGHAGAQFAFIQQTGTLSQTVAGFTPGHRYQVTFWVARRNGFVGGNDGMPINLAANGIQIVTSTSPTNDGSWTQIVSSSFVADKSDITFVFSGNASYQDTSDLIDDVHIVVV